MKPVKFEGVNCTYKAPLLQRSSVASRLDGEHLSVTSVWKPSAEDLEVLNNGGFVCLNVLGASRLSLYGCRK